MRQATPEEGRRSRGARRKQPERFGFCQYMRHSADSGCLTMSRGTGAGSGCFGSFLYVGRKQYAGRLLWYGGHADVPQCFGKFRYDRAARPPGRTIR